MKVLVKTTFYHVINVPDDYTEHDTNFLMNGSSSCADNFLDNINEFHGRLESINSCLCNYHSGEVVKMNLSQEDESNLANLVADDKEFKKRNNL